MCHPSYTAILIMLFGVGMVLVTRTLAADIGSGALGGVDWWGSVHDGDGEPIALPPFIRDR